jgi:hypothetical protein
MNWTKLKCVTWNDEKFISNMGAREYLFRQRKKQITKKAFPLNRMGKSRLPEENGCLLGCCAIYHGYRLKMEAAGTSE